MDGEAAPRRTKLAAEVVTLQTDADGNVETASRRERRSSTEGRTSKGPEMLELDFSKGIEKFTRKSSGRKNGTFEKAKFNKNERDLKMKKKVRKSEAVAREAVERLAMSEVLLTNETGYLEAEGREKTHHFSQRQILRNVDIGTAAKQFDLELPYGPYCVDYTKNGKYMVVGGDKGQLSMLDCHSMALNCEVQA